MNLPHMVYHRSAGDYTSVYSLVRAAYLELPELNTGFQLTDINRMVGSICENDRTELVVFDGDRAVAGCVIVAEVDQHVGPCLSLQWQYTLPAYRGQGLAARFIRELKRQAQWAGIPRIAWTHRTGVGKYSLTYKVVHGKENQEGGERHR